MQFLKDFIMVLIVMCLSFVLPYYLFLSLGYRNEIALGLSLFICSFVQAILMGYGDDE